MKRLMAAAFGARWTRVALVGLVVARAASAQTEFPQTLQWGSGLIEIPTAWVSPVSGDFSLSWGAKALQTSAAVPQYQNSLAGTGAFQLSLLRHAELGLSVLSQDFEHGFYGQLLLVNQDDFRGGNWSFLPSLAFGVRNVGPYNHIDRLGLGYDRILNAGGGTAPVIAVDSLHRAFSTNNTLYGVATKSFSLSDLRSTWPDIGVSFTVGYGNGLFSNHGAIPTRAYAADATGGLFYGIKTDFRPSTNTLVSFMAENNAWDINAGTYVSFRGLRAGIALTEIAAGSAKPTAGNPASALYRYSKFNFSLGWESNVLALLRGTPLRNRVAQLRKQREVLLAEIADHQVRITRLQGEIRHYEAQNLLELEERRAQAQTQLQSETDALHRLEERLRRVESETNTSPSTGPSTASPTSSPGTSSPPHNEHTP